MTVFYGLYVDKVHRPKIAVFGIKFGIYYQLG